MQTSVIQVILIDTLYYLTNNGVPQLIGLGSVSIRQPIYAGTIVGSTLGKPVESCIVGAVINTLYLGFINTGGTLPTDLGIGGVVGAALVLNANTTPQVTMLIVIPFGVMETMIQALRQAVNIYSVHQMDKYTVTRDIKKVAFWQLVPTQLFGHTVTMIPYAPLVYFDAPATQELLDMLVEKSLRTLSVIGGILPAVGIATIIRILSTRSGTLIFFTLGSFLEAYPGLGTLMVSIFTTITTYFYGELKFGKVGNKERADR